MPRPWTRSILSYGAHQFYPRAIRSPDGQVEPNHRTVYLSSQQELCRRQSVSLHPHIHYTSLSLHFTSLSLHFTFTALHFTFTSLPPTFTHHHIHCHVTAHSPSLTITFIVTSHLIHLHARVHLPVHYVPSTSKDLSLGSSQPARRAATIWIAVQ